MTTKMGLPQTVDPVRYAATKRELVGVAHLANMERLKEYLAHADGDVDVKLEFTKDEENRVIINVQLDAELPLTCQRCLQEFKHTVHLDRVLAPISSEAETERLPEAYEPVVLEEEFVSPVGMVEEELILSLPLIPMHAESDCPALDNSAYYGAKLDKPFAAEKPFAALAELKKRFK